MTHLIWRDLAPGIAYTGYWAPPWKALRDPPLRRLRGGVVRELGRAALDHNSHQERPAARKTMPHPPHIHAWYCTAAWQRRRAHQLRVEPLCRLCLEAGHVTPATVADHVVSHKGNYEHFRLGELRSLCAECHNKLDHTNNPRHPVRADGTPSDPKHWWNSC